MAETLLPQSARDVADAIADAARQGERLTITGGGSKAATGAPVAVRELSTRGLCGVVDYDPAELVLTVRPGTPLAQVQALVASEGQMLAFEPFDHGLIFGAAEGAATIGGVVAAGVAGSQRLSGGAARDHLLGFQAVSGRGEIFVAGGKVVKNVTGFDLPKLAAGSWGRLFMMTELTLKVLPMPRELRTLAIAGLSLDQALALMALAMGSQGDVAAAAYLPAGLRGGESATILRVQGFDASVAARCMLLETLLADFGRLAPISPTDAEAMWADLRRLAPLGPDRPLWRLNVVPSLAGRVRQALPANADMLFDWAGGLVWVAGAVDPALIRSAAVNAGGHAMLIRADAALRAQVPAFHPQPAGLAALEERVRRAFDPTGLFETGRF